MTSLEMRSAKRIGWRNMGKIAVLAMTGFALGSPQSSRLACTSRGIPYVALKQSGGSCLFLVLCISVLQNFMKVTDSSFFLLAVSEL